MSSIELRVDLWPIVLTTLPERLEEEPLERYLTEFEAKVLRRPERYASVTDAMRMQQAPNARTRQRVATWMDQTAAIGKRYNLGFALATSSILVRGAMTAINWIAPPAVPSTYEPDLASAVRWALAKLESNGVPVDPLVRRRIDALVSGA